MSDRGPAPGRARGKVIVCRCEDVTLKDVRHSIALGYADIEEVKRYTGFGTGPCQGKECHALIAAIIADEAGRDPASIDPFTARSPISPAPLRLLAAIDPEPEGDEGDEGDDDTAEEHD
ncbi:MAG TPA: (2Fe-2S)-binding protein [Kofleriaceae bacterium]|nr:(2Fe-2S)-binding protein [Kofleriaceae bacterium]